MYLPNDTLLQGNRYKIVRHISSGGFGNTYEGIHVMMGTRVAIKEFFVKDFCNRDADSHIISVSNTYKTELVGKLRAKFMAEAKSLFSMQHPNIVKVHDVFEENGTAYYVMDYIEGRSLNDIVKKRGKLPESEALRYIRQVANALQYVHSLNRLHLDVKPANIMVDGNGRAILIDFGASKHYDDESGENTSTLMGVNTKGYAPIEQTTMSFTSFSPATDIYALGATLYKLLTGITPPDAQLLIAEEENIKELPNSISQSTCKAIAAAMCLKRKDRPQSIKDFLALLDSMNTNDSESTVIESNVVGNKKEKNEKPEIGKRKSKRFYVIGGAIALLLLSIIFIPDWNHSTKGIDLVDYVDSVYVDTVYVVESIWYDTNSNTLRYPDGSYQMVYVSGGTFNMGSNDSDADSDEKPVHSVSVSSFYIGETEVTQALWKAVMGNNPSSFKGDNLPVECVSWNDCQEFIRKLNSATGKTFRLPTEAEWEFAARGGNSSRGYKYSGSNTIDNVAWYWDNSSNKTHAVGTKQANELGLYDMSGNVYEWCSDWYGSYSSSSQTNPKGPNSGSRRVDRGGSWYYGAWRCCVSYRDNSYPDLRFDYLGLRLVLVP